MKLRALSRTPLGLSLLAVSTGLILWRYRVSESRAAWSPTELSTPIQVQAVGREFYWQFRFPGPDQTFNTEDDASVDRELHLPANRDVVFHVTSDDYVYIMAIPEIGLRQIAVPELTFPMKFRADGECSFNITTDPLCGVRLLHDDDMGKILVQSESAFNSWYRTIP